MGSGLGFGPLGILVRGCSLIPMRLPRGEHVCGDGARVPVLDDGCGGLQNTFRRGMGPHASPCISIS